MDASVVVVSHGRPKWLARCLRALRQLVHPTFEIVVVADTASLRQVDVSGTKATAFDVANISKARNLGLSQSAGQMLAFIDDDAVPEPLWLKHLEQAFEDTGADAVVGYVRGRNGISFQSRVSSVDIEAETHEQPAPSNTPFIPTLPNGQALKLVGTNMAFRRAALTGLGGFDEAFAFYLDDTDISLRLMRAGLHAAVAPLAEVHHGFAPSTRRNALRAPTDLFDIGRSSAMFFRRHKPPDLADLHDRMTRRETNRLLRHMVIGNCEPGDIRKRLATLENGWLTGLNAPLPALGRDLTPITGFSPLPATTKDPIVLSSRLLRRRNLLKKAAELSSNGHCVSVFSFSLTPVRHHVRYTDDGVWLQTGGQFGRAERTSKRVRWCRFAKRQKEEIERVAKARGI